MWCQWFVTDSYNMFLWQLQCHSEKKSFAVNLSIDWGGAL